ncbi:MAG: hypothetical protein V4820_11895 [Pseudomonadota bacterium]
MTGRVPPMLYRWTGQAQEPLASFRAMAAHRLEVGAVYRLVVEEARSEVSHSHEFAWLKPAWQSLPDTLKGEFPSPEHLRKRALIETGWCSMQDYVCGTKAEAARWSANLRRELDEYALIQVSESVVRVFRAKSQAKNAMGRADFQASKSDIMTWISGLLEVEPETLARQTEAA